MDITRELKRIGGWDYIKYWNSFDTWTELTDASVTVRCDTARLLRALTDLPDNAGWEAFVEAIGKAKYIEHH